MTKKRRTSRRPGLDDKRYRAARERLKIIGTNVCVHCGYAIDMQLRWPHPLSWVADHVVPRAHLAADDTRHWDIGNLVEAHKRCNESRGAKPMPQIAPLETDIDW